MHDSETPTRQDLLNLLEELFGCRHPDFDQRIDRAHQRKMEICEEYPERRDKINRLLCRPLILAKQVYTRWGTMSPRERRKMVGALRTSKEERNRV